MDYCLQAFTKLNPMTSYTHKYYMKPGIGTVANLYRVQHKSKKKQTISDVNDLEKNKHPTMAKPQSMPK